MPSENKGRARKRRKIGLSDKQMLIVKILSAIFVVLLLLFMAAEMLGIASVSQVSDSVRNFFATLTPGDGFPHKINSSSVRHMDVLNGNLFIVTDEKTISLDTTAKQVKGTQHTYSNPDLKINGGKAIVFNRNDNRYRVENRTETLFTGETPEEEKIITCAIGSSGNIAIATLAESSTSKLTVLNKNYNEEVFVWNCAHDSIVAVSLSPNGKLVAVAVLGARDGEIYSKVSIFNFQYSTPVAEFEYPGTAMLDINFATNNNVVVIGDNKASFIKNLEKEESLNYGTSVLSAYTFSEAGDTVLVLSEHGSTNSEALTCYNSSFSVDFEEKYTSNVKSLYAADDKVAVLLDDRALVYRGNGNLYKEYEADVSAISIFNVGRNTYIYSIGEIVKATVKK